MLIIFLLYLDGLIYTCNKSEKRFHKIQSYSL